jgi:replicative DNA helicase
MQSTIRGRRRRFAQLIPTHWAPVPDDSFSILDPASFQVRPMCDVLFDALDRFETRHASANRITGITTGHRELDQMLHGLQPKSLIVVGGPADCGKTALALSIAAHVGTKSHLPILYFALDESALDIADRLLVLESGVKRERFQSGRLLRDDWRTLGDAVKRMRDSQIFLHDTPCHTVDSIRSIASWVEVEHGLSLIIIDRLELVNGDSNGDTWQELRPGVAYKLKGIAAQVDVPVIALSRLRNDLGNRDDFPPGPFDAHECESIKDADVVLSIDANRTATSEQGAGSDGAVPIARHLSVTCLKNNGGRTGMIKVEKVALGML